MAFGKESRQEKKLREKGACKRLRAWAQRFRPKSSTGLRCAASPTATPTAPTIGPP